MLIFNNSDQWFGYDWTNGANNFSFGSGLTPEEAEEPIWEFHLNGGNDSLLLFNWSLSITVVAFGGNGNDTLEGSHMNDTLDGGVALTCS